jgi:WXG100 family type VII secretion target
VSAKDEVAALPGGQALAELADKVDSAQPQAIRDLAGKWRDAAGRCDESGTALTNSVKQLDGAWEGASADGFTQYMGEFTKAGGSLKDALTNAAGDLDAAAGALESAKQSVDRICEDLLSQVRRLRAQEHGGLEQVVIEAMIIGLCAEAAGDAEPKVQEAEQALSGALSSLNGRMAAVSPKFSALADPNTQAFTPGPGHKIDWKTKPEPEKHTSSSGADGGQPGGQPGGGQPSGGGGHSGGGGGGGGGYSGGGGGGGGHHGGGGGGGGGAGSSGGPPPGGPPPGNVQEWIKEAIAILRQNGINVSDADAQAIWQIIQHESGGNPKAINNWDSNAAAGHPSKGLMQCIDSTFQAHKLPGHDDIWNPVDNIIAGVRYSISRYGSMENVPGVKAIHGGGHYVGY